MARPGGVALACVLLLAAASCLPRAAEPTRAKPNIVLIYTDDLGWGDVGSYGGTVATPNIDRLASEGLRFTHAHATSATCTPSRYSLLTGEYAWRRAGTGIATGDAALLIEPGRATLPGILQGAGYATGVVGKWHLGLGPSGGPSWNGEIGPGPLDVGFDYSFLIPATGDRVPTVYVENRRVVGLDPADPIRVSFGTPIPGEPTGKERPDLLKMAPSHGHDHTIVNGISRIGYMSGGRAARWVDEDMADVITRKAVDFLEANRQRPFFLYFSTHDIHVPRVPHPRFVRKTTMGPRGDVIAQLDWSVGEILAALDRLGLAENTLVVFTSDNGAVVDDGYRDQSVERLGAHRPNGPFRGGKYSAYEAGTRVPFIVRGGGGERGRVSDAAFSQVDLLASFAALAGVPAAAAGVPDSRDALETLLGRSSASRPHLVEQAVNGTLSLVRGRWKYIEPHPGPRVNANTNIELGNSPEPQLYDLSADPGETRNLAGEQAGVVREMAALLQQLRSSGRELP
ncbi:MAG: sulfatase-like hydrolase/transferase [Gemmatimonadetes bacterium]|nr:sulfatase-like hydrolase/transferase [Gemmatimonadota bacterium]